MEETPNWQDWFAERPIRAITKFARTLVEIKTFENNQRQVEKSEVYPCDFEELSLAKIDDLILLVSEGIIAGDIQHASGRIEWFELFRDTRSDLLGMRSALGDVRCYSYSRNREELVHRNEDLFYKTFCSHNAHRALLDDVFIHPYDVAKWLAQNAVWHTFIPQSMLEYFEAQRSGTQDNGVPDAIVAEYETAAMQQSMGKKKQIHAALLYAQGASIEGIALELGWGTESANVRKGIRLGLQLAANKGLTDLSPYLVALGRKGFTPLS